MSNGTVVPPNGYQLNQLPGDPNIKLIQQVFLTYAQSTYGPGGTLTFNPAKSQATLNAISNPTLSLYNINYGEFYTLPGTPVVLGLPNPGGGGAVGLTKIADDNSPLPRDRVIFDYDFFGGVPLGTGGVDVHRFSPGIEKTFFDGLASIEFVFPLPQR